MDKLLYCIFLLCVFSGCSSSGGKEDSPSNTFTVNVLDQDGNPISGKAQLDVYAVREDFNSLVPYADYEITGGRGEITLYRPTDLVITVIAGDFNPVRRMIEGASAGQSIDLNLEPRSGLRIMEYNVDYGWGYQDPVLTDWQGESARRKAAFVEWVEKYDPDIITFCELNCFGFGTDSQPDNIDADFQEFAKLYGHQYATIRKQGGRNSFPTGISSRHPLSDIEKVELQTASQTGYRVHGFVQAECEGITLIACHLSSQDARTREIEAEEIAGRVASEEYAMCSGDMNSDSREDLAHLAEGVWPSSRWWNSPPQYGPVDKYLDAGLVDSYYIVSDYFQATCSAKNGDELYDFATIPMTGMKVDCMMMTEGLAARCDFAEIIQTSATRRASDHFPYMVHIE